MYTIRNKISGFELSEQRLVGQARMTKANNQLSGLELQQLIGEIARAESGQSQEIETSEK